MNLLLIGGTVFVGRAIAEAAIAAGHDVTLFHRGTKGPGLVAGAQEIFGDREGDLSALTARRWDWVIDVCGYVPRVVRHSGSALLDVVDRYIFISTISVYQETDDHQLFVPIGDPLDTEKIDAETYGPLKVECETTLGELYGDRLTTIRPGLVAGAFDPTNRFTYWVERFAYCNDVLVPDQLDQPIQLIDARDLAGLTLTVASTGESTPVHAVGSFATFGDVIAACHRLRPETEIVLSPLEEIGAKPGADFPLVMPRDAKDPSRYENQALFEIEPVGPRRSLDDTARWTYQWSMNRDRSAPTRAGMSRDREVELIAEARRRRRGTS